MRPVRLAAAIAAATILLAACTSSEPGWTYAPPSSTPAASGAPSEVPGSPAASGAPSEAPSSEAPSSEAPASEAPSGEVVQVSATGIVFEQSTLEVPADTAFTLELANNDSGVPHDVDIRDGSNTSIFKTDTFPGVETRSFEAPALPAGAYTFVCTVHPNMVIDVTAG